MSKYPNSRQNTPGAKANEAVSAQSQANRGSFEKGRVQSIKEPHKDTSLPTYVPRVAAQTRRTA